MVGEIDIIVQVILIKSQLPHCQATAVIEAEPIGGGGRTEIWGQLPPCPMLATALWLRKGLWRAGVSTPEPPHPNFHTSTGRRVEYAGRRQSLESNLVHYCYYGLIMGRIKFRPKLVFTYFPVE